MNAINICNKIPACSASRAAMHCLTVALALLMGSSWNSAHGQLQPAYNDAPGAQVLTRGPVHEAFAGIVSFNPEPGVVVPKTPPGVIEEMPPEERPDGDNVTWIPGYWAWDDERSDFLWVSGTWRALPPGREWIAGYWGNTARGFQWTSGYWADAAARETIYLPAPPATVETGPNIAAPSIDYGWSPGCWVWYSGRYAWRPGYWVQGRADWDWCPAHYVWTPRGYIFVGGFWDYPVERRGVLFAPVYFEAGVNARRGYSYSPRIVIDLGVFSAHLFLRPSYSHYYFGDYYGASYVRGGFYASFSFQSSRHGYDPIYSHQRWEHRQDREWDHRVAASYQYRHDHESARPPRTWAAQRSINPGSADSRQNHLVVATPFEQLAKGAENPIRFQPVARDERQRLAQRGQEVQQNRDQRRTLESKVAATPDRRVNAVVEPARVQLPRSPIVSKSGNGSGRNSAPPTAPQAPKPDPKFRPQPQSTVRPPNVERATPQPDVRRPEAGKQPAPVRPEALRAPTPTQRETAPRTKESRIKGQEEAQRKAIEANQNAVRERETRAKMATQKANEDSQRYLKDIENRARQDAERRAKESVVRTPEPSPRNAKPVEVRPQPAPKGAAPKRPDSNDKADPNAGEKGREKKSKD